MTTLDQAKIRKTILAFVLGALGGGGAMAAFLWLGFEPGWRVEQVAVGGVGVVYLVTGLFTLGGTLMPGMGARVLNVADREELVEMRNMLVGSSVSAIALGIMLLALVGSGPGGAVPDIVVIAAVGLSLLTIGVIGVQQWRLYDELWRQLSWESSAFAMSLLLPILLIWGVAVHLGWLSAMDPLLVIAVAAASMLVGAFIAAGRRGMLAPR